MSSDELFMLRTIELARNGAGKVSQNPLVGCVITHENIIVGEGWHQQYGEAHAEVNAINAVIDHSILKDCTVYVSLEPCSHTGKTPPCADLLVRHQVKRVVVAIQDPNPLVSGSGIAKLKSAGIEVVVGVLEKEGRVLNKRFLTFIEKKRPYIILKWAQTSDGFIARENFDSKWISNESSRQLVHRWRAEEDAILVGYNTALHDNPHLTVRDWSGKNPLRIVIDKELKLDPANNIFDAAAPTICYNMMKQDKQSNLEWVKLNDSKIIEQIIAHLYKRKIQSLIVEGGAQTINSFLSAGLWDEARVFISSDKFEKGIKAPELKTGYAKQEWIGDDALKIFVNNS
ncbi:MAG TPA: bifunctional diaminohydroxyphosphoribosylaminopyrimidine deaminase/5-amino-6-(5-phosphoribosylamino)uracil reductase RibD [Cytophagales bacterium]|nr:bifunctional diaminohydroxyphosphoribosylaminopyrimidine deaminase/5-amino-6-(5-phosphoribosylamino)uracil reductase RibD [Cytophagales bacterium]HCR53124.1 bifunctional diaminohydroxyphosphoribosylaminopyrimidine deaminase/5-amino-6-(5-phosphoribosylamino)uracil reductase RibD [Cytophagales bacterium]